MGHISILPVFHPCRHEIASNVGERLMNTLSYLRQFELDQRIQSSILFRFNYRLKHVVNFYTK